MKAQIYEYRVSRVRRAVLSDASIDYTLTGSDSLADLFCRFCPDHGREHGMVALLNSKNQVIGVELVAVGGINGVLLEPRDVFRSAILANAYAVALAHNHPSGDPTPSVDDCMLTRRLHEGGELLGIPLLDHLVIVENGDYKSVFEELGLKR